MPDATRSDPGTAQALMAEMGLTDDDIEHRQRLVGLDAGDLRRIATVRDLVAGRAEQHASAFFAYLVGHHEADGLLGDAALLGRARHLKTQHLAAMVEGDYGRRYVEERLRLARLYSRAGLEPRVFLGAFHHLMKGIGEAIMKAFEKAPLEGFERFASLEKIGYLDVSLIVDVIVFERERVIRQQQEAIRELSTPVLLLRERQLLLPIVGALDTHRAKLLTDGLLHAIRQTRAAVVVMDVTGVVTIDTQVANHLVETITAAGLMGAAVVVTGLSSEVAQSLVSLGIDLGRLNVVNDLLGGIEEANRLLHRRTPGSHRA